MMTEDDSRTQLSNKLKNCKEIFLFFFFALVQIKGTRLLVWTNSFESLSLSHSTDMFSVLQTGRIICMQNELLAVHVCNVLKDVQTIITRLH